MIEPLISQLLINFPPWCYRARINCLWFVQVENQLQPFSAAELNFLQIITPIQDTQAFHRIVGHDLLALLQNRLAQVEFQMDHILSCHHFDEMILYLFHRLILFLPSSIFTGFISPATFATNWCTLPVRQPECPLLPSFGNLLNFAVLETNWSGLTSLTNYLD